MPEMTTVCRLLSPNWTAADFIVPRSNSSAGRLMASAWFSWWSVLAPSCLPRVGPTARNVRNQRPRRFASHDPPTGHLQQHLIRLLPVVEHLLLGAAYYSLHRGCHSSPTALLATPRDIGCIAFYASHQHP